MIGHSRRIRISPCGPSLCALRPALLLLPLLALVLVLPSCRKDELFTDEAGITLDFSRDSILFDTIFTTVGSITKRFTARNTSDRAVRVDISLEGGTPSPYRINVDGASGTSFSDVEILGGDSVYVFVEANLGPGGSNTPFVITDRVLFNTNGTEQSVLLEAWGQNAHFIRPDNFLNGLPPFSYIAGGFDENGNQICGETVTWVNDKPYVIYGYGVVDSCNTLIIGEGVRIYMHGGAGLWVYRGGRVEMNGTVQSPIVFQGDRLEPLYAGLPGQWDRIWINEGPEGGDNRMTNVVVRNALIGIQSETWPLVPDLPTSANKLVLNNVNIRNCSAAGILSRNYRIESNNLLVGDCGQYSVALTGGGEYFFNHSTIANYWNFSVRQTPAFFLTNAFEDVSGNIQVRPIVNSRFTNGIIHGNITREFDLAFNELAIPDVDFDHLLLKTDISTANTEFFDQATIYRNVEPGFRDVNIRDLHLSSSSFCRNKAVPVPGNTEAINDLDGVLRLVYDLGCYAYTE